MNVCEVQWHSREGCTQVTYPLLKSNRSNAVYACVCACVRMVCMCLKLSNYDLFFIDH